MGDERIFLKILRDTSFNKDLSNDFKNVKNDRFKYVSCLGPRDASAPAEHQGGLRWNGEINFFYNIFFSSWKHGKNHRETVGKQRENNLKCSVYCEGHLVSSALRE
jgi:hypothetical protein